MDTLDELREASAARQAEWQKGASIDPLFAAVELAGEVGEALNNVKKLVREANEFCGSRATVHDLGEELADIVICADLLAQAYGLDLRYHVPAKFNKTSRKYGLSTLMEEPYATGQG